MTTCTIPDCDSPVRARTWCNKHYRRWKRTGDPLKVAWERGDHEANFWAKVRRGRDDAECWPWLGYITDDGYGRFVSPRGQLAHRYSYELHVGPIPDGLELDHLCHTESSTCTPGVGCPHRRCVNPAHLRVIDHAGNIQCAKTGIRGIALADQQRTKTHCPRGHLYDEANTYVDRRGSRNCRTCARDRAKKAAASPERREYMHAYYESRKKI